MMTEEIKKLLEKTETMCVVWGVFLILIAATALSEHRDFYLLTPILMVAFMGLLGSATNIATALKLEAGLDKNKLTGKERISLLLTALAIAVLVFALFSIGEVGLSVFFIICVIGIVSYVMYNGWKYK